VDYLNGQTEENHYWRDIRLIDIHEGKYPSNSFLKQISKFKNEIAIYKTSYREWRLLTGEVSEHIFSRNIPDDVTVFIHSHPENSYDKYIELPSQGDLANYFKMAKNFIISPKGVTLFTLPKYLLEMDKRQRYETLENILNENIDKIEEIKIDKSNPFLTKIIDYKRGLVEKAKIKIKLFSWETKSQILKDFDKRS
ncbi:hypothetical protein MUP50_00885, partial [Patescibacteria group bacterium]|nr:hypothetical protein [Patescibacteria group bacterium]